MMVTRREGSPTPSGWLKFAAVVSALGMGIVNFIGFLDTQTGSALGCGPDWPLCNGQVIPRISNIHVLIEFAHRALVGGFALISVVVSIWALLQYRRHIEVKVLAWLNIAFIVVQSGLGALAVVFTNPPAVLALHLGFGLLAMIGAVLLAIFIFQLAAQSDGRPSGVTWRANTSSSTRIWVVGIWIYTYVAMYWGSYVAFRGGGEACSTWPLCNGKVFPGFSGDVGLDFIHRLFAVGLAVLAVLLLIHLRGAGKDRPDLARGATWFLIAVLMQIASGANLALSHVATGPYLLHITTLMFLFSVLSYLGLQTMPAGKASEAPIPGSRQAASRPSRTDGVAGES
ncbi:COX15/CtaA family protein [Sulfobacillus harzensis]|uniref:Heme A synthase n=1 Tax=Sulfobacillus harzensis TaxID=2729629 RepID=A0A7Y0L8N7_9FIRM|nr:COX15/CtaA family protein [Sulfobacillus harzensis]NMP23934.1 heme A synthase [Sulfobacillus harzensis]